MEPSPQILGEVPFRLNKALQVFGPVLVLLVAAYPLGEPRGREACCLEGPRQGKAQVVVLLLRMEREHQVRLASPDLQETEELWEMVLLEACPLGTELGARLEERLLLLDMW